MNNQSISYDVHIGLDGDRDHVVDLELGRRGPPYRRAGGW